MRYGQCVGIACMAALLLAACGGGGGGGGGPLDGSWQGSQLLATDPSGGATNVRLEVAPSGHAVVSWNTFHGSSLADVFVQHYDPATGWGTVVAPRRNIFRITSPAMQLVVNDAGGAVGIWGERQIVPGEPSTFYATTYDPSAQTWSPPVAMESDMTGKAQTLAVARGIGGSFWVLFGLHMGTSVEIHVNRFTPGGGWSGPVLLDKADWDPGDQFLSSMHIDADAQGNVVAAWSRYTDSDGSGTISRLDDSRSVFARRFDGTTNTWGSLRTLNPTDDHHAFVHDVVADPTGGFLVLWGQWDAAYEAAGYGSFFRGSTLQAPASIWGHADDFWARGAAFDDFGNAFVFTSADRVVGAFRYVKGSGWQSLALLQGDVGDNAWLQDFAVCPNGDAFALWRLEVAGDYKVFARRFDWLIDDWLSTERLDVPDTGDTKSGARICGDADGNAIATWHANDGLGLSYYAARFYKPTGWGPATEIDDGPLETAPYGVCVGMDEAGRAIAAWAQGLTDDEDVYINHFR